MTICILQNYLSINGNFKKSFIGECMSNKEGKWDKQFIKCCNLSLYHKNIRIRKKNLNRVSKLLNKLTDPLLDGNIWI